LPPRSKGIRNQNKRRGGPEDYYRQEKEKRILPIVYGIDGTGIGGQSKSKGEGKPTKKGIIEKDRALPAVEVK